MKVCALTATTMGQGARLSLNPAQVGARAHLLKSVGKGVYELKSDVMFKAGEEFEILGAIPKANAASLEIMKPLKVA